MRTNEVRKEQKDFLKNSEDPRPANFFMKFKYRSKKLGIQDYGLRLSETLQDVPESEKLLKLKRRWEADDYGEDWNYYEDEKEKRKADRKVKKRKCKAHVAFHDDLDERLDAVASSVSSRDCEDENGASSSGVINSQKKDENPTSNEIDEVDERRTNENLPNNKEDKDIDEEGKLNEAITDILGNIIECSETAEKICSVYTEKYPDGDLIDLRPGSPFLRMLPKSIAKSYLAEMDAITESLIPDDVHHFLVTFFSQSISDAEWQNKVDDLRTPDDNNPLMPAIVRILRRTLPQLYVVILIHFFSFCSNYFFFLSNSIKAFSLGPQNPLLNITTIEQAHLNAFVHPCLDSALWNISKIHYQYGEIPSRNHVNKNRADGAGFMTNADKFQLVYVEGSRPVAKQEKEISKKLFIFGGQSFRLRLYLYYLDFCGMFLSVKGLNYEEVLVNSLKCRISYTFTNVY
ncbi:hypothetical protein C1645_769362 [Glomus cerebriforme]|uniref:Uncharacterized protein n=1 Tax=Glomus cerebriforme TaxID=658196 RepID=A0A397SX87_9GLOM|nr:hypothetical protein C1645_769362 [Glomus cerebriforme]